MCRSDVADGLHQGPCTRRWIARGRVGQPRGRCLTVPFMSTSNLEVACVADLALAVWCLAPLAILLPLLLHQSPTNTAAAGAVWPGLFAGLIIYYFMLQWIDRRKHGRWTRGALVHGGAALKCKCRVAPSASIILPRRAASSSGHAGCPANFQRPQHPRDPHRTCL